MIAAGNINNQAPEVQTVKKLASSLAKCLDNNLCLESFAKYAASVHGGDE